MAMATTTATNIIHVDFRQARQPDVFARLRQATALMDVRLEEQRREVREFKATTRRLRKKIDILKDSLRQFRAEIDGVDVKPLHRKSRRLIRLMESGERTLGAAPR